MKLDLSLVVVFVAVFCFGMSNAANNSTSCLDRCEDYYDSENFCQCNDRCMEFGNCCDDYFPFCANESSCMNRCDEVFDSSYACHCDSSCSNFGNCCNDYISVCGPPPSSSCEGRCSENSPPTNANCYCDDQCEQYGNCCDDYVDICGENYYCKGECNVTKKLCNCTDTCIDDMSCCSDYKATCLNEKVWADDECTPEAEMRCPADFDVPPVILFSIDGFKAEYIYRHLTPNIWKLASCGVHAPYMRSVYPTKTFPNHYSIATGLYPESHGIIDNTMYDHELQEEFRLGRESSFNPAWWGGEPFWVTTSNQGKISATYFWPGSDVNITRYPDYYFKFDGSVPYEERVYQGLKWLDLPKEKRPSFITLYVESVDSIGHSDGPVSPEIDASLAEVDKYIGILMDGLKLRNLHNCVNIILLADHGMAPISCDRKTNIEEYGVDSSIVYDRMGAAGRIGKSTNPSQWPLFDAQSIYNKLKCTHEQSHWQVFFKDEYHPKRFHYANNERIEPILLVMDDEWLVEGAKGSNNNCNGGTHGYDNEYKSMHALFTAHGPGFKRAYNTTRPFEAIEVYNLMADLLDLTPAPNNGTTGALYNVMSKPKQKEPDPPGKKSAICSFSDNPESSEDETQNCLICPGTTISEANKRLKLTPEEMNKFESFHMPFGRPGVHVGDKDKIIFCLLDQQDYINAFESTRKMPKFVSYTLTNDKTRDLVKLSGCSRPDSNRLSLEYQTPCSAYSDAVHQVFLYPSELSNGDAVHDALINTNSVPMYASAVQIWNYLSLVLAGWADNYGGINVISGPVFDYNYDGLADSEDILLKNATYIGDNTPVPTHFFLVITRCRDDAVGSIEGLCGGSPENIEVLSFIVPNYKDEPCHTEEQELFDWIPGTLFEHIARVRDVELIAGVSFFTSWTQDTSSTQEQRLGALKEKLHLPQFTSQWLDDFRNNAPPAGETVVAEEKYYCNGQCNVTRKLCNCTHNCIDDMSCCSDYKATCLGEEKWVEEECAEKDQMFCSSDFDVPPVILFSIDGFKAEYIYRHLTPNIWKLASCGVHAPYMRSVYPTKTFPNHYSIATGLYPESHGIIDNRMYDHDLQEEFRLGRESSFNPAWWGGEPIWVSTSDQGKISATYFWPGSDVNITRYPDYYFKFDGNVPYEERVYQGLKWLDLPKEKRPSFITLYIESVDSVGHSYGPVSPEIDASLVEADKLIGLLMDGLKLRNLHNCVNIILLADHGMAPISCSRQTNLESYGVDMSTVYSQLGAAGRIGKSINPSEWNSFDPEAIYDQLKCTHDQSHWQVFFKDGYHPKRFHYANNDRIEPILLVMDDEWLVEGAKGSSSYCNGGTHGYDNEYKSMHALFTAHGPGFKRSYNTTRPFEAIEVYNLMADLLEITPAPNNGTAGALYDVMSKPKQKEADPPGRDIALCVYNGDPSSSDGNPHDCLLCPGLSVAEANDRFYFTIEELNILESLHMPFGRPHVFSAKGDEIVFCLLDQQDYVNSYEFTRKMPKYVSYTLKNDKVRDLEKLIGCSRPDASRIGGWETPCSAYSDGVRQAFLYPPELSNGDAVHDALINTNAVPMYAPAVQVWNYLSLVLADWAHNYGGINVISGPVFDYNYDGLADSDDILLKSATYIGNNTSVPTHFFLVITRCRDDTVESIDKQCGGSPENIEVLSFIVPNYRDEPCHTEDQELFDWVPGTLFEHVARVRDVELIAGVSFFTSWTQNSSSTQEQRLGALREKLHLPQFTSQWLDDFRNHEPPTGETIEATTAETIETTSGSENIIMLNYCAMFYVLLLTFKNLFF